MIIPVRKLHPDAVVPTKAHPGDAGWDLATLGAGFLRTGQVRAFPTGIALEIPPGWYGQVFGRSSLGLAGIDVLAGVVDCGFRGELVVILLNHGGALRIEAGDRVAQLVILPVPDVEMVPSESLADSDRGETGFGGSGR